MIDCIYPTDYIEQLSYKKRYSRRIMWLKVGTTNKNPRVIASLFLKTVESVGGKQSVYCIQAMQCLSIIIIRP